MSPVQADRVGRGMTAQRASMIRSLALAVCLDVLAGASVALAVDWSDAVVAWRGDPRPPADAPSGIEPQPSRRAARRARRAAARNWTEHRRLQATPPLQPEEEPCPPDTDAGEDAPERRGVVAHRDVAYVSAGHARQKLDLFLPQPREAGRFPVVVWIHGDTWRDGSKSDCPIRWLVEQGYAVASIGYRLTDDAVFPAQLDDCSSAVAFLHQRAGDWNLDPDRCALVGIAAGGHLAALVGLDAAAGEAATNEADDGRVSAVCVVAAPTLLTALGPGQDRPTSHASLLVGGPIPEFREAAQRASPLTHVSKDSPPFLILHARKDRQSTNDPLPVAQSRQFDAALKAAGAESTFAVLDEPGDEILRSSDSTGGRMLIEFLSKALAPRPR